MRIQHQPILSILFSLIICCLSASAQTFSVIHTFTGGSDGAQPYASVTLGGPGTLYGTAYAGGLSGCSGGCGVAFKMTQYNGAWVFAPLHAFTSSSGSNPVAPVAFGPGNLLYGTAAAGGTGSCATGCGVVFTLQPPPTGCRTALCYWTYNPIYEFASLSQFDPLGNLAFDHAGHVYGSTYQGAGCGTIFQLTRSGLSWTETMVYQFRNCADGIHGPTGVTIDASDNLYLVSEETSYSQFGSVYEATPSGSGWTVNPIYNFQYNDGFYPEGVPVIDAQGNLYGTTSSGGTGGGGTVFALSPNGSGWNFVLIDTLVGLGLQYGGPWGNLAFDSAGNLYGTTLQNGSHNCGSVFKLTRSGQQWIYSDLYDFTCGNDGAYPYAGPTIDSSGNVYGTTTAGGSFGQGVVWEIRP